MGSIEVLSPLPLFLRSLKTSKMCINPRVRTKVRVRVRGDRVRIRVRVYTHFLGFKKVMKQLGDNT